MDEYTLGHRGPEIDLKFECPGCHTCFYTFVAMADFEVNDNPM